ncbi:HPr kinase/phosphatase C-terminal domain-containing protein [Bradyrhizobium sp. LHD-71]|uniref:HPr kinase/phosphorylase n=1 Tax=Bradyrhizobium sp. LHD-71 TaxID=3072141 RepID=UPI00280E0F27|nr:HPr kinase/phosphatase C-terminal domain-containing protein [Bradyrhizobium sp. LHD-71]MDQ8727296.1 HPr kinase/phosphatase C-terminal domain-containing protein [Bradyrhizobium sp. LHD-71]
MTPGASVHASAVQAGDVGILIRGPSAAGKSRLAFDLMLAGRTGQIPPTRLVGDDRILLSAEDGRLIARPPTELEGLIEVRGLGIRRCDFVTRAVLGLVVDLAAADAARMPEPEALTATVYGIKIPRIPVEAGANALPLVVAALLTDAGGAAFGRLLEGNW